MEVKSLAVFQLMMCYLIFFKKFNTCRIGISEFLETYFMAQCSFSFLNSLTRAQSLSRIRLFVTPWTTQSVEFSRPEYWSGQPFPSAGDLPNPGMQPRSPSLQADSLPAESQGKPVLIKNVFYLIIEGKFLYYIYFK